MKFDITKIMQSIGPKIGNIISDFLSLLKVITNMIVMRQLKKEQIEKKKIDSKYRRHVEDVVDKGNLDDLLDLKKVTVIVALCMLCGCISETVVIQPTLSWEGHFMNIDDFKRNTEHIQLNKGQSVWVLSNTTLKRVLENNKGN